MIPDYVVVTLRTKNGNFEADYELPAKIPVSQVCELLLKNLAQKKPQEFGLWKQLYLSCDGRRIADSDTLAGNAIWDGSILGIEEM